MGDYTKGRLHISGWGDGDNRTFVLMAGERIHVAKLYKREQRECDARRLVACWNYCEAQGLTTEQLERTPKP